MNSTLVKNARTARTAQLQDLAVSAPSQRERREAVEALTQLLLSIPTQEQEAPHKTFRKNVKSVLKARKAFSESKTESNQLDLWNAIANMEDTKAEITDLLTCLDSDYELFLALRKQRESF